MKQEYSARIRASKPNANTENFFEIRAPSSTSPPSPRRISNHYNFTKRLQLHQSTQLYYLKYKYLLVIKRPQTLSWKILFPYKSPCRTMSRIEALVCKWKKENEIREFWKTLQKMREIFSTKTKEWNSFECFKLLKLLQIFVVMNLSLNIPIYSRGLGFKDKTHLRLIRKY